MRRFDMRLPAVIKIDSSEEKLNGQTLDVEEILTETHNVSARGIFFYLDHAVAEGTRIEVTMTFPPHITMTEPVRVRFTARVVRVEPPVPISRIGIAAMIQEYEFLHSHPVPEYIAANGS